MLGPDRATVIFGQRTGTWTAWRDLPRSQRLRIGGWVGYVGVITVLFVQPLARLLFHSFQNSLHSHIPLVPLITAYLLYIRPRPPVASDRSSIVGTAMLGAIGLAAVAAGIGLPASLSANDHLALMTLAYLSFVAAGGLLFLGSRWMAAAAFPIAFLIFMVPLPDAAVYWLERGSVLASADAAALFFNMTGTPLLRDGVVFALPGITIQVAQECSGIRSSWVLFITSVLAAHLFLRSPWRRLVLVAFVIPLAIVRNGFRILVIGLLCIHVGPHMIDSFIHRQGGPIFFALSLGPLFLLLWWLWHQEHRTSLR